MTSHRSLRVAEAIREVVASAVLFEAADPRLRSVTVLRAEVSADLRQATIYVSVMGSQADARLALRGLKHAAGFLQSKVADRLQTRYTPVLSFKLDESEKKSVEIGRLIDEAVASDQRSAPAAAEPPAQERAGSPGDEDPRNLAPPDRS
jgi:ribosome-binding factor A